MLLIDFIQDMINTNETLSQSEKYTNINFFVAMLTFFCKTYNYKDTLSLSQNVYKTILI